MHTLVLSTGSNLGDRLQNLDMAQKLIEEKIGHIRKSSSIYESRAWGYESENNYYNQCLEVQTEFEVEKSLERIIQIERILGRKKRAKEYTDRIIDIDIIFFDDHIQESDLLTIPHSKMQDRRFVLVPLAEILPLYEHPVMHKTVRELLGICTDPLRVYPVGKT
jgi:2-amino-4-hydroxy-6-hydroxymethyldihydropteridine diphosphokinase